MPFHHGKRWPIEESFSEAPGVERNLCRELRLIDIDVKIAPLRCAPNHLQELLNFTSG